MRRIIPPFIVNLESSLARGLILDCLPGYGPFNNALPQWPHSFAYGTGITITRGPYGKQVTLDGAQGVAALSFSDGIDFLSGATEATIACLYYAGSGGPIGRIGRWGTAQQFGMFFAPEMALAVRGVGGEGIGAWDTDATTMVANAWHHCVISWKAIIGGDTVQMFVNGVSYANALFTGGAGHSALIADVAPYSLVGHSDDAAVQVVGNIVYVRQWSRALTHAEVVAMYQDPMVLYRQRKSRARVPDAVTIMGMHSVGASMHRIIRPIAYSPDR